MLRLKLLFNIKIYFILLLLVPSLSVADTKEESVQVEECITAIKSDDVKTIINKGCYKLEQQIIDHLSKDTDFNRETLLKLLDTQKEFFENKNHHYAVVMGKTIIGVIKKNPEFKDIEQRSRFITAYSYGFLGRADKTNEILLTLFNELKLEDKNDSPVKPSIDEVLERLAMFNFVNRNFAESSKYGQMLLERYKKEYGNDHPKTLQLTNVIKLVDENIVINDIVKQAGSYVLKDDFVTARRTYNEFLDSTNFEESRLRIIYLQLARINIILNDFSKSEDLLLSLLKNSDEHEGNPKKEEILKSLVELYFKTKKPDKIIKYYEIAAAYLLEKYGSDNAEYLKVKENLDGFNATLKNNTSKAYIQPKKAMSIFSKYCINNIDNIGSVDFLKNYGAMKSNNDAVSINESRAFTLNVGDKNVILEAYSTKTINRCDIRDSTSYDDLLKNIMDESFDLPKKTDSSKENEISYVYKKGELNYVLRLITTNSLGNKDDSKRLFTLTVIKFLE
jgi:tetratricopeptide (TPR) repeat protein